MRLKIRENPGQSFSLSDGMSSSWPSARMTAFIILDSIYTGKNARMILKYSTAIPILFSDAPNKVKSCVFNGKKTAISTRLERSIMTMPVPIALWAAWVSFRPWQMPRYAAQPSPKHQAKAWAMIWKEGKLPENCEEQKKSEESSWFYALFAVRPVYIIIKFLVCQAMGMPIFRTRQCLWFNFYRAPARAFASAWLGGILVSTSLGYTALWMIDLCLCLVVFAPKGEVTLQKNKKN